MSTVTNRPERDARDRDANRDPITGEPGAHPVGTGVGAAIGGAAGGAAVGAAVGSVAGPVGTGIGTAAGVVAGAVGGGLAGKAIAEEYDPTVEDGYWRQNYASRPYYQQGTSYDEYAPAYRYGCESCCSYSGRSYDDVETDLERGWDRARGKSSLTWERAKHAVRDAWNRLTGNRRVDATGRPSC